MKKYTFNLQEKVEIVVSTPLYINASSEKEALEIAKQYQLNRNLDVNVEEDENSREYLDFYLEKVKDSTVKIFNEKGVKVFESEQPERREIEISWCVDDVLGTAKDMGIELSDEEALDILDEIDRRHDCEIGINWDVIRYAIEYFDERRK